MPQLEANKKMAVEEALLELDVAAVLKKQLQVLGVEAELGDCFANRVRRRAVGGWACPAVRTSGVFEGQVAAVLEEYCCLCELGVGDVASGMFPGEI